MNTSSEYYDSLTAIWEKETEGQPVVRGCGEFWLLRQRMDRDPGCQQALREFIEASDALNMSESAAAEDSKEPGVSEPEAAEASKAPDISAKETKNNAPAPTKEQKNNSAALTEECGKLVSSMSGAAVDSDSDSSCEMEIPYTQNLGVCDDSDDGDQPQLADLSPAGKEPLRPGDYIEYYHPQFVAMSSKLNKARVVQCHPENKQGIMLTLSNNDVLPSDTQVARIREYSSRRDELLVHRGVLRNIEEFRIEAGTLKSGAKADAKLDGGANTEHIGKVWGEIKSSVHAACAGGCNPRNGSEDDDDDDDDDSGDDLSPSSDLEVPGSQAGACAKSDVSPAVATGPTDETNFKGAVRKSVSPTHHAPRRRYFTNDKLTSILHNQNGSLFKKDQEAEQEKRRRCLENDDLFGKKGASTVQTAKKRRKKIDSDDDPQGSVSEGDTGYNRRSGGNDDGDDDQEENSGASNNRKQGKKKQLRGERSASPSARANSRDNIVDLTEDSPPAKRKSGTAKPIDSIQLSPIHPASSECNETPREGDEHVLCFDVPWLAYGTSVLEPAAHCRVLLHQQSKDLIISYDYQSSKKKVHVHTNQVKRVHIHTNPMTLFNPKAPPCFLALHVNAEAMPSTLGGFELNHKDSSQLIVMEMGYQELTSLAKEIKECKWIDQSEITTLKSDEIDSFLSPLVAAKVIDKKKDEENILTFPFGGDKAEIDQAARGLDYLGKLPDTVDTGSASDGEASDTDGGGTGKAGGGQGTAGKLQGRAHFVTVRAGDYRRLDPGEFLNDTLIDFFIQWQVRNSGENVHCSVNSNCFVSNPSLALSCRMFRHNDRSQIHFFSTHFYTALSEEGVGSITKWTANKNINIFEKKFIFIPVNKNLHWSLSVVINCGEIMKHNERIESSTEHPLDAPVPCLLFLDPMTNYHERTTVQKNILKWLNAEWKRVKDVQDEPFDNQSMSQVCPKGLRCQMLFMPYGKRVCILSFL